MILFTVKHESQTDILTASGFASLWNDDYQLVLKTTSTHAQAALESIQMSKGLHLYDQFRIVELSLPLATSIFEPELNNLSEGYNRSYRSIGSCWYKSGEHLLMKVPSTFVPESFNYLVNLSHYMACEILIKNIRPIIIYPSSKGFS